MSAFKGTYPRIYDRPVYEENGERKFILLTTVILFDIRASLVGMNQILNRYMPKLSAEAHLFLRGTVGI